MDIRAQRIVCKQHSYREARLVLGGLSHRRWKRSREEAIDAPAPPPRGRPADRLLEAFALEFVTSKPGVGRAYIAAALGTSEANVQNVREHHRLSTLDARLRFAGFDPKHWTGCSPDAELAAAPERRG